MNKYYWLAGIAVLVIGFQNCSNGTHFASDETHHLLKATGDLVPVAADPEDSEDVENNDVVNNDDVNEMPAAPLPVAPAAPVMPAAPPVAPPVADVPVMPVPMPSVPPVAVAPPMPSSPTAPAPVVPAAPPVAPPVADVPVMPVPMPSLPPVAVAPPVPSSPVAPPVVPVVPPVAPPVADVPVMPAPMPSVPPVAVAPPAPPVQDDDQDDVEESEDPDHFYVCILQGPGKSVKVGIVSDILAGSKSASASVCMSKRACLELMSQKYQVKAAEKRGYCPGKNRNTVEMSDSEITSKLLGL